MTTLRWVRPFALGAPLIDRAHRQMFDRVRAAIVALQQGRRREAAGAIALLGDDACRHFHAEDLLMKSVGYPGYYNHGEQHRRQLLGLERMQVALALRPPAVASSVRFLRSWFTLHLLQFDRPLSTYLRR